MEKQIFLLKYCVIFLFSLVLATGCNNEEKKNDNPPLTDNKNKKDEVKEPPTSNFISGILDTLVISATNFKKLTKNKASFIFYLGGLDTVTLHGWENKGGTIQYNTPPDVRLIKGNPSGLTYGLGTYFGNVNLGKVNKIITDINSNNATHVLFAPQKIGSHVGYKIFLSKDDPFTLAHLFAIIPTGEEANPSPPRNY